jgi:hypothetical protein
MEAANWQKQWWKVVVTPKDSRVCSEHFEDGNPTTRHPFPTRKLGYEEFESRVKRILFLSRTQSARNNVIDLKASSVDPAKTA